MLNDIEQILKNLSPLLDELNEESKLFQVGVKEKIGQIIAQHEGTEDKLTSLLLNMKDTTGMVTQAITQMPSIWREEFKHQKRPETPVFTTPRKGLGA